MKSFENYLIEQELSAETIKKYLHDAEKFVNWSKQNGTELNRKSACEWKEFLISQGYAPTTINAALAAFNRYAEFMNMPDCRLKYVKAQKKIFIESSKLLSKKEYKSLVCCAQKTGQIRLSMIMETIVTTGMRVSELKYVTVECIDSGCVQISMKGKIRTILIPNKLCEKLKRYVKKQDIRTGAIFVTKNGKIISRKQIWYEMKKICESAGISKSKVFPHNLRHLFARMFYEISNDIVELSDILGHSSIETTRIYLRNSSSEHRLKLEKLMLI